MQSVRALQLEGRGAHICHPVPPPPPPWWPHHLSFCGSIVYTVYSNFITHVLFIILDIVFVVLDVMLITLDIVFIVIVAHVNKLVTFMRDV